MCLFEPIALGQLIYSMQIDKSHKTTMGGCIELLHQHTAISHAGQSVAI